MVTRNYIKILGMTFAIGLLVSITNIAYAVCPQGATEDRSDTCCFSSGCDFDISKKSGIICDIILPNKTVQKRCCIGAKCYIDGWCKSSTTSPCRK